jgi:hypothetical protein
MEKRITGFVSSLKSNEIFVFGSNLSGRHGKGAARQAMKWGAKYGKGNGIQGNTYGIPTVNARISNKLSLKAISSYVDEFIQFAKSHPEYHFLVSEIGCGLAGWTVKDIAPLFREAVELENISLPKSFWKILKN